ncbi:MAG: DUF4491 family protein [Clostridiales bacterium]|jgi:hypothetical protein|nr:DUF4491 family protein [Clostridiales bacterium]
MNFLGILAGLFTFSIIGALHPVVIKAEYYIGKRCWPLFLISGSAFFAASFFCPREWSSILSITGFSLLWCILELFEQEKRVEKGWFPANPAKEKRKSEIVD